MKLTVLERLQAQQLYPQESTIENQIIVKQLIEKLSLTEAEMKKINLRKEGDLLAWDDDIYEIDVNFSESELILLKAQVDKLNDGGKITQQMLSLCLKIKNLFPKQEEKK